MALLPQPPELKDLGVCPPLKQVSSHTTTTRAQGNTSVNALEPSPGVYWPHSRGNNARLRAGGYAVRGKQNHPKSSSERLDRIKSTFSAATAAVSTLLRRPAQGMPDPPLTSLSFSLRPSLDAPRPPARPAGLPPSAHPAGEAWGRGRPSLPPLGPLTSWGRASVAPPAWRPSVRLQRPPPPLPPLSPPPRPPPPPKLCPARRRGWEAGERGDPGSVGWEVGAAGRRARRAAVATLAPGGWLRPVRRGGSRGARVAARGSAPRGGIGDAERRCRPRGGDGGGGAAPLYSVSRSSRVCARLSM